MKKIITTVALCVTALMLLIALNASQRRTAAAELALTENTLAAVADASAEMEALTLALDKLLMTTSPRQTARLLSQISLSADRVQMSLAALPDTQGQQAAVLAYLSRLSNLCQTSLADLAEGDAPDPETRQAMSDMLNGLRLLEAEMHLAQQDVSGGVQASELPPTLITAPPTALELAAYKALPSTQVGSGEAMRIAREFVGDDRVVSVAHAPDTAGALPAFGVTVQTADVQLNLEITRHGGKVLLMSPETADFPALKSVEECTAAALAFLSSRGFAQMEAPWYQVYDGLCVLTCAYVQNGVLIWPDRVLVQVRMDTAQVVGIEARSYWKNHIPRKLQSPLLTEDEARAGLNSAAEVRSARLCLLPSDGQERLCWQFSLTKDGAAYIAYIDAMTGSELQLEKIMQLENGQIPA